MSDAPFRLPLRKGGSWSCSEPLCSIRDADGKLVADRITKKDADYIIEAVNEHEELIAKVGELDTAVGDFSDAFDEQTDQLSLVILENAKLRADLAERLPMRDADAHTIGQFGRENERLREGLRLSNKSACEEVAESERLRALCRVHEETIITVAEKHANLREENAKLRADSVECVKSHQRTNAELAEAEDEVERLTAQLAQRDSDERIELVHMGNLLDGVEAVENALNTYCERLADEVGRLRSALQSIAEDPHQSYDHPSVTGSFGGQYGIGVVDGHRCAATKARAALEPKP